MTTRILTGKMIEVALDLVTEECCNCHMLFAMPRELNDKLRRNPGSSFWCPAGHGQHYTGESEETKLRRERDRLRQQVAEKDDEIRAAWNTATEQRDRADTERRRANGYKGHATKIARRAVAGVCPCCNRTFAQLARHMASQHPTFTPLPMETAS